VVEVVPISIEPDAPWQFAIDLNTHSVELDDDLVKQAVLIDDQNQVSVPIQWTGSEPIGHHRSGTLLFNPLQPSPASIELRIRDVGDIPLRSFRWEI
ncbi:MAG: hypothetical protein AAB817_01465, partial [Patescibacteria group bacterium]